MYVCWRPAVYVPEILTNSETAVPARAKRRQNQRYRCPRAVAVLLNGYGDAGVFVLLGAVSIIVAVAIATIGIETAPG